MNMAVEQELHRRDFSDFVPRAEFESAMLETRFGVEIDRMSDKVDGVRKDMDAGFAAVRKDMDAGFAAVRGEIGAVRKDMDAGFAAVRGEIGAVKTDVEVIKSRLDNHETQLGDLKRDFGQFREEVHKEFRSQTRWFIGTIFAVVATPAVWHAWQHITGLFAR